MKLLRIMLPLVLIGLVACNEKEKQEIAQLKEENAELVESNNAKDSLMNMMFSTLLEVEDNLVEIRGRQNTIDIRTAHNEKAGSSKERILDEIAYINGLLLSNEESIKDLQEQLKKAKSAESSSSRKLRNAKGQIEQMEKLVASLQQQNEQKNLEIASLKEELVSMNYELDKISMAYAKELQTTEEQKTKLNTAYYAVGSFKELKAAEILTKKGSFIGMGGATALVEDFNKEQFIEINIEEVKDILIGSKKVQMATYHPAESYELESNEEGLIAKLVIKDPESFWSVSKFLVMVKS